MYEVIMKYSDIMKYFECYMFEGERLSSNKPTYILKITNIDMDEYYKNIISYNEDDHKLNYYCIKSTSGIDVEYSLSEIYNSETIIFEFPDEETAFYFKLKFCNS